MQTKKKKKKKILFCYSKGESGVDMQAVPYEYEQNRVLGLEYSKNNCIRCCANPK